MMNKSAKVKFAKAISGAASTVYIDTFVKQASERGIVVDESNLPDLLKTAAALRTVADAVAPVIKEANDEFISDALESLLAVEL